MLSPPQGGSIRGPALFARVVSKHVVTIELRGYLSVLMALCENASCRALLVDALRWYNFSGKAIGCMAALCERVLTGRVNGQTPRTDRRTASP